jgi:hypothetical protein
MHSTEMVRVQVVSVLNEAVVLAGFFAAGRREHQERLHWGRAPSLLYRLCSLPTPYFSCDDSTPHLSHLPDVLLATLIAACAGVQRNCEVVCATIGMSTLVDYARHCNPFRARHRLCIEVQDHACAMRHQSRFDPELRVPQHAWQLVLAPHQCISAGACDASSNTCQCTAASRAVANCDKSA